MALRTICRAVVMDQETARILLVRNQGASFWYPPGGGWEAEKESVLECVVRETFEEAGIRICPVRLLYVQEFHPDNNDIHLELFWLAYPISETEIHSISDAHGIVEEARWFTQDDVHGITVYPKRLASQFWHELGTILASPNPFLKKE